MPTKPQAAELLERCSEQELSEAQSACKFWRIAILVKPFCGWPGLILEALSCFYLYRARKTLRTPFLVWLLIAVGPAWGMLLMMPSGSLAYISLRGGVSGIGLLFVVGVLLALVQVMTSFFVRNAIFRQWNGLYTDADLEHCIRYWERAFLFFQLPALAVYIWVAMLWLTEGWQIEDFKGLDITQIAAGDISIACVPFVLGFIAWLAGLIYEYKILSRFETRLFAAEVRRRKRKPAERAS